MLQFSTVEPATLELLKGLMAVEELALKGKAGME